MKKLFIFILLCCFVLLVVSSAFAYSDASESYRNGQFYQKLMSVSLKDKDEATRLVEVAMSQEGYIASNIEADLSGSPSNYGGKSKYTEYNHYLGAESQDWCAAFVSWCAAQAGIDEKTIGRNSGAGYFRENCGSRITLQKVLDGVDQPRVGDLILFNPYVSGSEPLAYYEASSPTSHIGIVTGYHEESKTIDYIAGNETSNGKRVVQFHKNCSLLTKKKGGYLDKDGNCIYGADVFYIQCFKRPNYSTEPLIQYTVQYDLNGGTGDYFEPFIKVAGRACYLTTQKPLRTGYTFVGWAYHAADSTPDYYSGAKYHDDSFWNGDTATPVTLYAVWLLNESPALLAPEGNLPDMPVLLTDVSLLHCDDDQPFFVDEHAGYANVDISEGFTALVAGTGDTYSAIIVVLSGEPRPSESEDRLALLMQISEQPTFTLAFDAQDLASYTGRWVKFFITAHNDIGSSSTTYYMKIAGQSGTVDSAVYDAADNAGDVVNADVPDTSAPSLANALDVVLVLDASGSMELSNPTNGKQKISYAQDAACAFVETVFAISPQSNIAVVSYASDVTLLCDFLGVQQKNQLVAAIRRGQAYGRTNTGGGFERAQQLLLSREGSGALPLTLMLSDGLANEGPDAVDMGTQLALHSSVYTIGLIGGLDTSERDTTRATLHAGYEHRYFEVDFEEMGDISQKMYDAFLTVALSGSSGEDSTFYRALGNPFLDLRITCEDILGELCNTIIGRSQSALFGSLSLMGDQRDRTYACLADGDYTLYLRSRIGGKGEYSLDAFAGMDSAMLANGCTADDPYTTTIINMQNGQIEVQDFPFNPIDPDAIDPFTQNQSVGPSECATGYIIRKGKLLAAPVIKAYPLIDVAKNQPVLVLAVTQDNAFFFLSMVNDGGLSYRGWYPVSSVEVSGFVPQWPMMDETAVVSTDLTYVLPDGNAQTLPVSMQGTLPLKHIERDAEDNEWVYLETSIKSKIAWVYVPASALSGWQVRSASTFHITGNTPQVLYENVLTKGGYSELMWAGVCVDDNGDAIVCGRTDVKKGPIDMPNGKRDAWIVRLDEKGEVTSYMSTGGSDVDSFHCVQPFEGGYAISGITRSTDKSFSGIWSQASYSGSTDGKLKSSNALIGVLDDSFMPLWFRSMGIPSKSYGFDMVLPDESTDTLVGVGWSTAGKGSVLQDYGKQDFYVARFASDGTLLAQNTYGTAENDVPDSGILTEDGGVLMVGKTYNGSTSQGYVVRFDADLQLLWSYQYGGTGDEWFDNVRELPDSTYLLTGYTDSTAGSGSSRGSADFWAVRMDALGRVIWSLHFGGDGYEEVRGTTMLGNGQVVIVGQTNSTNGDVRGYRPNQKKGNADGWALCIDEEGQIVWSFCLGSTGNDYFNAACEMSDGALMLVGAQNCQSDKKADAWVVKLRLP